MVAQTKEQEQPFVGVVPDMSNEQYHAHPAVSRSKLWKMYTKTAKHAIEPEDKKTDAMDFGSAVDVAILEPHLFEAKIIKGPSDRRGNRWKELVAANVGRVVLVDEDYDACLRARDSALANPLVKKFMLSGLQYQHSAFAVDEKTGVQCRVRPDAYSGSLKLMADLKTSRFVNKFQWEGQATDLGYHVQEAMYPEVWTNAGGGDVEGFLFIVVENEAPYSVQCFEFDPDSIAEGKAVFRAALKRWQTCMAENYWPGPPTEIQQVSIRRYGFKETTPFI